LNIWLLLAAVEVVLILGIHLKMVAVAVVLVDIELLLDLP
jgi:hypothetical protein